METHFVCGTCHKRLTGAEILPQTLDGRIEPCCPVCRTPCRPEPAAAEAAPAPLRMIRRPSAAPSASAAPAAVNPPPAPVAPPPAVVPPPLPPAAPSAGLRFKAGGEPDASSTPPGSEAPAELVMRVQQHVAEKVQKQLDREARIKKNPWAAFFFPFKPLSMLAIALMLVIFSGIQLLMDIGLADDDEPKKTKPAKEEPAARAPTSILQSETAGSGAIVVKSGGKSKVVATTEDVGTEASKLGFRKGEAKPEEEAPVAEEGWLTRYRYSGPYDPSRYDRTSGEFTGEETGGAADFLFPGLIALGLSNLFMRAFLLMYFSAVLLNIIYETGNGVDHFPRWPNPLDIIDSFLAPAYHFLLCLALSFGPSLVAFIAPFWFPQFLPLVWMSAPFLLLLGIFYFPLSLMCVAVRGEKAAALPSVVLPALAKAHIHYAPVMLAFLLIPAWPWISEIFLAEYLKAWQRILLDQGMHFTLLVVVMRGLGLLFRRIEAKLGWTAFARA